MAGKGISKRRPASLTEVLCPCSAASRSGSRICLSNAETRVAGGGGPLLLVERMPGRRTIAAIVLALASVGGSTAAATSKSTGAPSPECRKLTSAAVGAQVGRKCPLVVEVRVHRADMKNAAASRTIAKATCGRGSVLTGGGILQDRIDGSQPN